MLPKHRYVVSYADWGGWGHVGYIYQACNVLYTGLSALRTDVASHGQHSRTAYKKGMDTSERQPRSRKHRYIYVCASNKREKKEMLSMIRYKVMPYPKGESRRYDTSDPHSLMPSIERKQNKVTEVQGDLFYGNVLMEMGK